MLAGAGNAWELNQLFTSEKYSNRGTLKGEPAIQYFRTCFGNMYNRPKLGV